MGLLRFMTAGSVDDGKSTLIGRLFQDAGLILDDQMKAISRQGLNLAYFTDGLKEEREQGITIDVAYRYFESAKRKFIVADSPGHKEFTRNMVTAATHSDAILILVDATRGVSEQTKRHTFLAHWLGVRSICFLINKMDLVNYSQQHFLKISAELALLGPYPVIPISALLGENILTPSAKMPWYEGVDLFTWLHSAPGKLSHLKEDLRFPVQLTYGDEVMGTIKSGTLKVGDELKLNASEEKVLVKEIHQWPDVLMEARAGMALRLKLDRSLSRGDLLTSLQSKVQSSSHWKIEWCYLLEHSLKTLHPIILRHETSESEVSLLKINELYDLEAQTWNKKVLIEMRMNEIYSGEIHLDKSLVAEIGDKFALINGLTGQTIAGGILR